MCADVGDAGLMMPIREALVEGDRAHDFVDRRAGEETGRSGRSIERDWRPVSLQRLALVAVVTPWWAAVRLVAIQAQRRSRGGRTKV